MVNSNSVNKPIISDSLNKNGLNLIETTKSPLGVQYQKTSSRRKLWKYGGFMLGGMFLTALLTKILKQPREVPWKSNLDFKIGAVPNIQVNPSGEVWSLAISPDGEIIASGNNYGTIEFFEHQTGDIVKIFREHKNVIRSLVFIPQTNQLISGDGDGKIKLWNWQNNIGEREFLGHLGSIWSLAISPNGQTWISCSEDETIRVWNLATGQTKTIVFSHETVVYALAFSPDGQIFASAGKDKIVKIWKAARHRSLLKSLEGHQDTVRTIAISPNLHYSWENWEQAWKPYTIRDMEIRSP